MKLTIEEKKTLLKIARAAIEARVARKTLPKFDVETTSLKENRGAFVTLHQHGDLRGCIGYVEGIMPLAATVKTVAAKAAMDDPRFPTVMESELESIEIEISAMSPLEQISSEREIEIGRDGLLIELGPRRGLLLPQVATENDWDVLDFLSHTCIKAGLPIDAWKRPNAKIFRFSVELFSEKEFSNE